MNIDDVENIRNEAHLLVRSNTSPEIQQLAALIEALSLQLLRFYNETHGGR